RDRPQGGGLARPVGAENRRDPTVHDAEADAVQRLRAPVEGLELLHLQEDTHAAVLPRYARMTSGSCCTSAGVPSAIFRPKSSTTTRSEICMTRLMWCSTSRMVSPRCARTRGLGAAGAPPPA